METWRTEARVRAARVSDARVSGGIRAECTFQSLCGSAFNAALRVSDACVDCREPRRLATLRARS